MDNLHLPSVIILKLFNAKIENQAANLPRMTGGDLGIRQKEIEEWLEESSWRLVDSNGGRGGGVRGGGGYSLLNEFETDF